MLQRIRTLAVQSSNGTLGADDRKSIQNEVTALTDEITRIAEQTTFGGKKILMGYNGGDSIYGTTAKTQPGAGATKAGLILHVGANKGDTINMEVYSFQFTKLANAAGLAGTDLNGKTFSVSTQCAANRSATSPTSPLTPLMHVRVSVTQTSPRSPLTCRNSPSSSRLLPPC